MARLLRIVDVGGKPFCAWMEYGPVFMSGPDVYYVTFTIDSTPDKRRELSSWMSEEGREKEAIKYFEMWLDGYTKIPPSQENLASEIEKLAELRDKGVLSEDEFVQAKRKLIGDS